MKIWILILFLLTIFGCTKEAQKTELMLHFEKALEDTQSLVDKANGILDDKVAEAPIENLNYLVYAKDVADQAENIFKKAKIFKVEQPELDELFSRLHKYDETLAPEAISLMKEMAQKTIDLRKRINEIKSQPYSSGKATNTDKMVNFLGNEYNKEIRDCCLDDLHRINTMLRSSPDNKYNPINKAINNAIDDLTLVLKEESGGQQYLRELEQLTKTLEL
jgi:hypothetical protein